MAVDLDDTALVRWRASPIAFIEEMLHDPETGRPFVLLEAKRAFMRHAFTLDRNGRLALPRVGLRRDQEYPARPHAPR